MKWKLNYLRGIKVPAIGFNLDGGNSSVQRCNATENQPVTGEFDSQGSNKEGFIFMEKQAVFQRCESGVNPFVVCDPTQNISLQIGGKGHVR